jgi:pimeloyl-ACP methyl ester carboxylesterase
MGYSRHLEKQWSSGRRVMTSPTTFENFEAVQVQAQETRIFLRRFGAGPAVLLLHGFPQTHLMWRSVAPLLARSFTVICADLRGYGRSGCPASAPDHAPYAKRAMARDMISVMEKLGFPRFSVAGHDRGGRVAYRLALDHPERVERLAVLDIIPTADAWERPTSGWRRRSGRGRCLRSPSRCLSGWCQPRLMPSSMTRLVVGALPQMRSALTCGRRMSRRCVIPLASTQSVRNIERGRLSTASMIWRIAEPGDR